VDAGYRGRAKEWAERALGLSVEVVYRSPKPTPEKVLFAWAREWHKEEGRSVDLDELMPRRGFEVLARRWVVERTFAWICHNRRMSKDYERLCATGEAFVYAAMTPADGEALGLCVGVSRQSQRSPSRKLISGSADYRKPEL
jgi:putative transposase